MNTRLLGTVCMVGALAVIVDGVRLTLTGTPSAQFGDRLTGLAFVLYGIGGICGIVGLLKLNALGMKVTARAMGFLPMIGFAAFILGDGLRAADLTTADAPITNVLTSVAWITLLTGMLVVGILTIAAKSWRGWRRFVPLLTVMIIPIGLGIGTLSDIPLIAALIYFASWVLFGGVVATAEPTSQLRHVTA